MKVFAITQCFLFLICL